MLQKGAAVLALALVAGCGSSMATDKPEPVTHHLVYENLTGETRIWIADVDGSHPRPLVEGGSTPVISPNGKWVAYLDDSVGNLYVIESSGGDPKLLAEGRYRHPTWLPDSERIAAELYSDQRGGGKVVSFDIESGEGTTVLRGEFSRWSFSPDGTRLVFAMSRGSNPRHFNGTNIDLFVAGRDGGDAKRITDTGDSDYPVWGPNAIAFARLVPYEGWGRHELWQIQPDGSGRKTITGPLPERLLGNGWVGLIPLGWSDDGKALLAAWSGEFDDVPVAVDPDGGGVRVLVDETRTYSRAAAISRDGRYVLAESGGADLSGEKQSVFVVSFAGGESKVVLRDAVSPSWNR